MRLIHTKTGRFHTIDDPRSVRYAILSHVWAKENDKFFPEPTLHDIRAMQAAHDAEPPESRIPIIARLPEKVRRFCQTAAQYQFDFAWGDSFCIDKGSSSELSEAINSMFDWYRYARLCFVYLSDVPPISNPDDLDRPGSAFRESRWFRRGWTLQELLAPTSLFFFSSEWTVLGSKHTLSPFIEQITGIPLDFLTFQRPLEASSVACRMSWAVGRETTREEDEAYSLMGIFGVKITTTYGEGRHAFIRLQEEILRTIPDQTIFAWGLSTSNPRFLFDRPEEDWLYPDMLQNLFKVKVSSSSQYLFASSPRDFQRSSHIAHAPWSDILAVRPTYTITPYGIRTRLPVVSVCVEDPQMNVPAAIALLACKTINQKGEEQYLALILRPQHSRTQKLFDCFVGTNVGMLKDFMRNIDMNASAMDSTFSEQYYRIVWLSKSQWDTCSSLCKVAEVYIPHRRAVAVYNMQRDADSHAILYSLPSQPNGDYDGFEIRVSKASEDLLAMNGYLTTPFTDREPYVATVQSLIGSPGPSELIHIDVRRCDCHFGERERFLSVTVSDRRKTPQLQPEPHTIDDERHVRSWTFRNGTASHTFLLRPSPTNRLTIRLSLTRSIEPHPRTVYILEIEAWKTHAGDVKRVQERMRTKMSRRGSGLLKGYVTETSAPTSPSIRSDQIFPRRLSQSSVDWPISDGEEALMPRGFVPLAITSAQVPEQTSNLGSTSFVPLGPVRTLADRVSARAADLHAFHSAWSLRAQGDFKSDSSQSVDMVFSDEDSPDVRRPDSAIEVPAWYQDRRGWESSDSLPTDFSPAASEASDGYVSREEAEDEDSEEEPNLGAPLNLADHLSAVSLEHRDLSTDLPNEPLEAGAAHTPPEAAAGTPPAQSVRRVRFNEVMSVMEYE
ncbi:HET-domain-containing protein [Trametes sanguinea]|nr:HET-domain-containing protein [Trametes sanguinea]